MTLQSETTPLLRTSSGQQEDAPKGWFKRALRSVFHVENRILFAGFLITLSFSFTQVPLLYVFRLMECDIYYDTHPPYEGDGDRCSVNSISAGTATQFSILGMSTTLCGTINLFVTGWMSKKYGPRAAILVQTFVPAIRVLTQIIGVVAGRREGIVIIQATQLITILGGPAGYILMANIITGELVEPARRTAVFGQLQGTIMLGQGIGYLAGGMLGDIDIRAPFDTAFVFFLISALYVQFALPYIDPSSMTDGKKSDKGAIAAFLAPLKILVPQRLRLADGRIKKHYGVIFLCAGIFIGVLATGYAPLLIQMYATGNLGFSQADNGWLMSGFAMMRALFLISAEQTDEAQLPTDPAEFDAPVGDQADEEPVKPPAHSKQGDRNEYLFDLVFLRWSLLVDGALTTLAAFATEKWHIYLATFLLPLGSGTAPAAKGVITDMCSGSQRADALNAVTLVENIARLATQGLFGFVFSTFSNLGIAYVTFFCNAAIAVLGMGVLLFSHFPPEGAQVIDQEKDEDGDEDQERTEA
uniref:Major facilitator superfamily (MFS) profile domain-containing protein n=1 Tax=Bionectria ochroleuca TaxID=29856 RepID=A0A0B7KMX4_BIOOC